MTWRCKRKTAGPLRPRDAVNPSFSSAWRSAGIAVMRSYRRLKASLLALIHFVSGFRHRFHHRLDLSGVHIFGERHIKGPHPIAFAHDRPIRELDPIASLTAVIDYINALVRVKRSVIARRSFRLLLRLYLWCRCFLCCLFFRLRLFSRSCSLSGLLGRRLGGRRLGRLLLFPRPCRLQLRGSSGIFSSCELLKSDLGLFRVLVGKIRPCRCRLHARFGLWLRCLCPRRYRLDQRRPNVRIEAKQGHHQCNPQDFFHFVFSSVSNLIYVANGSAQINNDFRTIIQEKGAWGSKKWLINLSSIYRGRRSARRSAR